MKFRTLKKLFLILPALAMAACHADLDQDPIDPDSFTEKNVFANAEEAKGALAKLYASFALTGQEGPSGKADLSGIDEGFSEYFRMLYKLNELTTDHAVVGWGDAGLPNLHEMSWGASNDFTSSMYFRLAQTVSFTNSFIDRAGALGGTEAENYIAEARFLRAYSYYNLIDLYGNVPLTTQVTTALPEQSSRKELFDFVESELLEIQDQLKESGANEYGRVDRVAAWALLSRLYLNAEVWTGIDLYAKSLEFSNKVINSTYVINKNDANGNGSAYDELFLADNDKNGAQKEFIFTANYDGVQTKTYGGTTFLVNASIGDSLATRPDLTGVSGGWFGLRTTKALVNKFDYAVTKTDDDGDPIEWEDSRAMFWTPKQELEINDIAIFSNGYAVTKFKNIDSQGNPGKDETGTHVDTDLPIIRLAEIYLNYAEVVARGKGGDMATAVGYINELRERAFGDASGNITSSDLTLDFIEAERSRELYWEGQRRTDLIRFKDFTTGSYLWPFKGGSKNGTAVEDFRRLFPLPSNLISINPNLTQNTGY